MQTAMGLAPEGGHPARAAESGDRQSSGRAGAELAGPTFSGSGSVRQSPGAQRRGHAWGRVPFTSFRVTAWRVRCVYVRRARSRSSGPGAWAAVSCSPFRRPASVRPTRSDASAADSLSPTLVLIATPDDVHRRMVAEDLARAAARWASTMSSCISPGYSTVAPSILWRHGRRSWVVPPASIDCRPPPRRARLRDAYAGLEGDERALHAGERLARALGHASRPARAGRQGAYHAGAVVASNYIVVLAARSRKSLARKAGVPPAEAPARSTCR